MSPIADAVYRLKGLFLEVPGTRLSVSDASKLAGLDAATCEVILMAFVDARFLSRTNGWFVRPSERSSEGPRAS
jgi:hypothetical protein